MTLLPLIKTLPYVVMVCLLIALASLWHIHNHDVASFTQQQIILTQTQHQLDALNQQIQQNQHYSRIAEINNYALTTHRRYAEKLFNRLQPPDACWLTAVHPRLIKWLRQQDKHSYTTLAVAAWHASTH